MSTPRGTTTRHQASVDVHAHTLPARIAGAVLRRHASRRTPAVAAAAAGGGGCSGRRAASVAGKMRCAPGGTARGAF
eukprot:2950-Chlamydomonas_euryale.AAC.4